MKKYLFIILVILPLSAFAQLSYDWSSSRYYPETFSWYTNTGIYQDNTTIRWAETNNANCTDFWGYNGGAWYYPISSCVTLWNDHFITFSFFNEFDIADSLTGAISNVSYLYWFTGARLIYFESWSQIVFDIYRPDWSILQHNYKTLPIWSWSNPTRFLLANSFTINNYYNSTSWQLEQYLVRTSTDIYTLSWKTFSFKSDFLWTSAHWTFLYSSSLPWPATIDNQNNPASIFSTRYVVADSLFPIWITVFDEFREKDLVNWTASTIDYQDNFYDPLPTDTWSTIWECDLTLDFVWFFGCTIKWLQ